MLRRINPGNLIDLLVYCAAQHGQYTLSLAPRGLIEAYLQSLDRFSDFAGMPSAHW